MTDERRSMDDQDLRVLPDLGIYSYSHFGSYPMVIYEDQQDVRRYSNVDIIREAAQLGLGLRKLGVEQGDRVIVMMLNCPEVIVAYQGIPRAGGIIIPVLPLLKPPEVRYIAENSGAKAIITSPVLVPMLQSALADVPSMQHIITTGEVGSDANEKGGDLKGAAQGDRKGRPYMSLHHAPTDLAAEKARPRLHAYGDVVAMGAAKAEHFLSRDDEVQLDPDDTAVIIYTSGTTGNPKGVILTHRNLIANALSGRGEATDVRNEETHLAVLPLAHGYGILVSNIAFLRGSTAVLHPRFDTTAVFAAIERYHIAGFAGVPAMFVALLYSPDADRYDTSSLQQCVSGSAPLPIAILEGFEKKFGCKILEGYGLTEGSAALTGHSLEMEQKPGSVGKPLANIEVLVVDENDEPVPVGEIGEVIARGPNVMKGYYNMPEETAAAMRNGWLHTGDLGRFDEDGYLYIVGRKKDMIIRGGFNIYPVDIEEVLDKHPAVIESAVVGIPSERMGEEVKAFVVIRSPVDAETLKAYCREVLANYKTPSEIEFVDSLPRNPIGKIDKKELRKRYVH
jgi:long-chain acyl-CoA synthetase